MTFRGGPLRKSSQFGRSQTSFTFKEHTILEMFYSYSHEHQSQNYAIKKKKRALIYSVLNPISSSSLHERIPNHLISYILRILLSQRRTILLILSLVFPHKTYRPLCWRRIHQRHFPPHTRRPLIQSKRTTSPPPY